MRGADHNCSPELRALRLVDCCRKCKVTMGNRRRFEVSDFVGRCRGFVGLRFATWGDERRGGSPISVNHDAGVAVRETCARVVFCIDERRSRRIDRQRDSEKCSHGSVPLADTERTFAVSAEDARVCEQTEGSFRISRLCRLDRCREVMQFRFQLRYQPC